MRRKAIFYSQSADAFALECGHWSPVFAMPNTNLFKSIERLRAGRLYRECGKCQRRENKAQLTAREQETT